MRGRPPPPRTHLRLEALAPEIQLHIASFLPYPDLVALSSASASLRTLVLTPALHRSLFVEVPVRRPGLLLRVLPHARSLTVRQRPAFSFRFDLASSRFGLGREGRHAPSVSHHLEVIRYLRHTRQLEHLDLSGVRLPWSEVWPLLAPQPIRQLAVRACGVCAPVLPDTVEELDAAFNSIVCLDRLGGRRLRRLDLSWNSCLTYEDLEGVRSPELLSVNLKGIDTLTRGDVRRLGAFWDSLKENQVEENGWRPRERFATPPPLPMSPPRTPDGVDSNASYASYASYAPSTPPPRNQDPWLPPSPTSPAAEGVKIIHSALLESDDEQGYRQFIHQVTTGVVVTT